MDAISVIWWTVKINNSSKNNNKGPTEHTLAMKGKQAIYIYSHVEVTGASEMSKSSGLVLLVTIGQVVQPHHVLLVKHGPEYLWILRRETNAVTGTRVSKGPSQLQYIC